MAASIKCDERPFKGGSGGALPPQPKFFEKTKKKNPGTLLTVPYFFNLSGDFPSALDQLQQAPPVQAMTNTVSPRVTGEASESFGHASESHDSVSTRLNGFSKKIEV